MSPRKKQHVSIFATNLTDIRKTRHMSQEELAEKTGMSRSIIAYYETAARNPTLEALQKFADVFDVSIAELTEDTNNQRHATSKLDRQVEKIKHLSPTRQRMISNTLDALISG